MKELLAHWQIDGTATTLLLLITGFMFFTKGLSKKATAFATLTLVALCFFSPLAVLSSHYLFSAHMIVHVLLLLAVGPLLVLCLPSDGKRFGTFFLFLKQHPLAGWLTGIGTMWFWHVPVLFNSAMASSHHNGFGIVHIIEALSLILAGVLFSAPVVHPNQAYRLDALSGVVYLFTACVGCSLLGLLITFAPPGMYRHFLSMHDNLGLNKIILQSGITQASDQQAAGLIMWVPCCLIYVSGAMILLMQWFKQKDETVVCAE